jgi:hypothetical protein
MQARRHHPTLKVCMLVVIALALPACSGYHLGLQEATVLSHDANHISYRVIVKNQRQTGVFCTTTRFYGRNILQSYLANAPRREDASIVRGAGGVAALGRQIQGDPNNAYDFRVIEVEESVTVPMNVTINGGLNVQTTPYLIIELTSSTERNYSPTTGTGTSLAGCVRYGETRVIDLRTVP